MFSQMVLEYGGTMPPTEVNLLGNTDVPTETPQCTRSPITSAKTAALSVHDQYFRPR